MCSPKLNSALSGNLNRAMLYKPRITSYLPNPLLKRWLWVVGRFVSFFILSLVGRSVSANFCSFVVECICQCSPQRGLPSNCLVWLECFFKVCSCLVWEADFCHSVRSSGESVPYISTDARIYLCKHAVPFIESIVRWKFCQVFHFFILNISLGMTCHIITNECCNITHD